MSLLQRVLTPFGEILDRIICIFLVLLFMQLPMYINQYVDVLSGARMEARRTYDDLGSRARENGLSVVDFVERLKANEDVIARESGEVAENVVARFEKYSDALDALTRGTVWSRPFQLMAHYDRSIHAAMHFEPGLPLHAEGLIYALVGLVFALLIVGLGRWLVKRMFGKKKRSLAA